MMVVIVVYNLIEVIVEYHVINSSVHLLILENPLFYTENPLFYTENNCHVTRSLLSIATTNLTLLH